MRHISIASTLFLAALFCMNTLQAQDSKSHNIDNSNIALQGYSPVSYLDLGLAQRGRPEFKSTHEGIAYYFTSAEQKATFDKNPSRYMPQYGGFCAFGVYAGAKFRPDPNKFLVKDGKYYLYLYNLELDAQQLWLAEGNHSKLVRVANKNWQSLRSKH